MSLLNAAQLVGSKLPQLDNSASTLTPDVPGISPTAEYQGTSTPAIEKTPSLRNTVIETISHYYRQIDLYETTGIYDMVLAEIEEPLLETIMRFVRGNQSLAAIVLGISRGTLRKKLEHYSLDRNTNTAQFVGLRRNIEEDGTITKQRTLYNTVLDTIINYFRQVNIHETTDVYDMVLSEIEEPLLETTLRFLRGNQSRAAILLGISRGTLRKKLKRYDLD